MRTRWLAFALAARAAHAQPVTKPADLPVLATIRDDKELAEALSQITADPAVQVTDPNARALAQGLMTEGVKQLQAKAYDQALANFLAAYGQFPSPKILLNIAAALRDMGRLADAANTYQRYLVDPATGSERLAEVKDILIELDKQLTLLTVRVFPRGSEVSIDGGPFVAVGASEVTRVRPGLHLVTVRKQGATSEITINGFEAEKKDIPIVLQVETGPDVVAPDAKPEQKPPPPAPEHVEGWLITGTQYGTTDATSRSRVVHTSTASTATDVAPIIPHSDTDAAVEAAATAQPEDETIGSGALAILRIDGHARGAAGGVGIAYTPNDHIQLDAALLRSDFWGLYLGARYRFLTGLLRPYVAVGVPTFAISDTNMGTVFSPGVRGAIGLELKLNGHISIEGDLGGEHFFNLDNVVYQNQYKIATDVFVPTLGVVGRM